MQDQLGRLLPSLQQGEDGASSDGWLDYRNDQEDEEVGYEYATGGDYRMGGGGGWGVSPSFSPSRRWAALLQPRGDAAGPGEDADSSSVSHSGVDATGRNAFLGSGGHGVSGAGRRGRVTGCWEQADSPPTFRDSEKNSASGPSTGLGLRRSDFWLCAATGTLHASGRGKKKSDPVARFQ
jgi:hypothetical protein